MRDKARRVARMRDKAMRGCSHAGQSYEGLLACETDE